MKKRGFGVNLWNGKGIENSYTHTVLKKINYVGFGGKVEPGETVLEAAHRELEVRVVIHAAAAKSSWALLFRKRR